MINFLRELFCFHNYMYSKKSFVKKILEEDIFGETHMNVFSTKYVCIKCRKEKYEITKEYTL